MRRQRQRRSGWGSRASIPGLVLLLVAGLVLRFGFGIDLFGGGAGSGGARDSRSAGERSSDVGGSGRASGSATHAGERAGVALDRAIRERQSEVWVEFEAEVSKTLPDDDDGSRHQRFLVRLADGRTLLVAHNIDIAPRVPLERGDRVAIRGKYVWNDQGGVIHWTHRAESGNRDGGRLDGGWIESGSVRYE